MTIFDVETERHVADEARGQLCFSSFVARERVHRAAVAEVLLTDFRAQGDGRALGAAQWARGHRMFRPYGRLHDTLLVAETLRQAGICAAATVLDVPADHRVIMDRLSVSADADAMAATPTPTDVVLDVRTVETTRRTRAAAGFRVEVDFSHDGRKLGGATGWARCVAPRVYDRLRGHADAGPSVAPAPVAAHRVGMGYEDDVVVGAARGHRWPVRVLPDNPILFDHPLDHVPGMLMLEAFRQAARLHTGWPAGWIVTLETRIHHFVEIGAPSWVVLSDVTRVGPHEYALALTYEQEGRAAADAVVVMLDPAALPAVAAARRADQRRQSVDAGAA